MRAPGGTLGVIILAAGAGTRFGSTKQLAAVRGRPLLQHALDSAAQAVPAAASRAGTPVIDTVVVLGHDAGLVAAAVVLPAGMRIVTNADHARGQASSLRCGLLALDARAGAALVLLGDQPHVDPDAVHAVLARYAAGGRPIVRPRFRGTPGHPVLLHRSVWPAALELAGDAGARDLMTSHPDWVETIDITADAPADVDVPGDLPSD